MAESRGSGTNSWCNRAHFVNYYTRVVGDDMDETMPKILSSNKSEERETASDENDARRRTGVRHGLVKWRHTRSLRRLGLLGEATNSRSTMDSTEIGIE